MSITDQWEQVAQTTPSRPVEKPKAAPVHVRTSVSWTAEYPAAVNKFLLEAQQATGNGSLKQSLVIRVAVRALEQLEPAARLELMKMVQEERDNQLLP